MLYKQLYSDIASEIRQISADSYIPPRFVYYETINIIADFLRKDQDAKRKLAMVSEGWLELEGVDLEEVPTISCPDVDVRLCSRMMKSKLRIPETFSYTFGNIIKHLASPNFSFFFNQTTPRQWNNIQKLTTRDKNKYYFFFIGGYLYIPIPKEIDLAIQQVRMEAYFVEQHQVEQFKKDSSCYDCKKIDLCKSPMDYEITCPMWLLNSVKQELLNRLVKIFVPSKVDEYPNMNSNQYDNSKDIRDGK